MTTSYCPNRSCALFGQRSLVLEGVDETGGRPAGASAAARRWQPAGYRHCSECLTELTIDGPDG